MLKVLFNIFEHLLENEAIVQGFQPANWLLGVLEVLFVLECNAAWFVHYIGTVFRRFEAELLCPGSKSDIGAFSEKGLVDSMSGILFLGTGNSCRSQMAEGFAKSILGHRWGGF